MRNLLALIVASSTLFACEFTTTRHPGEAAQTAPPQPRPQPPAPTDPKPDDPVAEPVTTPTVHTTLSSPPDGAIDWTQLTGHWYATNQYQPDGTRTFVRADPGPSRFRQHYIFDGRTVKFRVLASNDGHYSLEGTWTRRGERVVITAMHDGEETTRAFDVVSMSADSLRLRYAPMSR